MTASSANKETVVARIAEIAERVGASEGLEIVDVEFKGGGKQRLVRIFIDKPGGVSHDDCQFVSRNVGTILDVEDVVPGDSYRLEVSSPGIDRPLRTARDFERVVGQLVVIALREAVVEKRRWEGTLTGIKDDIITLEPASGEPVRIALDLVERANLTFKW
jgi:ribosome maturation factor RimP